MFIVHELWRHLYWTNHGLEMLLCSERNKDNTMVTKITGSLKGEAQFMDSFYLEKKLLCSI